jgi:hypothetical protein
VALVDEIRSRGIGDTRLREIAGKATAAIDLEAPLIEVVQKDGEPQGEQSDRQQQQAGAEGDEAPIRHVHQGRRDRERRPLPRTLMEFARHLAVHPGRFEEPQIIKMLVQRRR